MAERILIASPVQQKPTILAYFLFSLRSLQHNHFDVDFLFIDDNIDETSSTFLQAFQDEQHNVTIIKSETSIAYQRDEKTHYWNDTLVDKVAAMKDQIIEYAITHQYDGLFLVDSDLMLHLDTLQNLHQSNKDIISSIFWTKWRQDHEELPQVWMMDEYSFHTQNQKETAQAAEAFLSKMRKPGIYEVGGLGACTLIRRNALLKGVRFKRMHNLSFWGEDRHFCIRAAALGLQLFVDTRLPSYHIYREGDLAGAEAFKLQLIQDKKEQPTISLCMIVRDEESVLERCLSTVSDLVDEIIIVDTGSTDRTKEIAATFTQNIYDFPWIDDFAAARNFSFDKATSDYILWLDADDILTEDDRNKFKQLTSTLAVNEVDSVMMDYHLTFDTNGKPTTTLKRNRLVKRAGHFRWIGAVHEYLEVSGKIIHSDLAITHKKVKAYTDRNLKIYQQLTKQGHPFSARDVYYYGNELYDHRLYEEAIQKYEEFLATKKGWVEDNIAACLKLADCYGALHKQSQQLQSIFRSFEYGLPRAESYCRLGSIFMDEQRYHEAIHWYEQATTLGKPPESGSVVNYAAWTWLPYLQLCVCYDKLGQHAKAYECNQKALHYHPTHPSMLRNNMYFKKLFQSE